MDKLYVMTTKQKTFIRDLIKYFDSLQYTNDISSPSLSHTLSEDCDRWQSDYSLTDIQTKELEDSLWNILNVIRKI